MKLSETVRQYHHAAQNLTLRYELKPLGQHLLPTVMAGICAPHREPVERIAVVAGRRRGGINQF
jgi:hypothetical protein